MKTQETILVAGHVAEVLAGKPLQIMPWGAFEVNGRSYQYTEESIGLIREGISAHGVELPIDYDHGTSTNPPANGIAVAAGWMRADAFRMEAGQPLTVLPEWTPVAARHVQTKEFKYVSPTFHARQSDGVVVGLHSVALTNKPAIARMPAIAANTKAADAAAERTGVMKTIITQLGLAAEASEEQVLSKVKELQVSASEAKGLREAIVSFAGEVGDDALKTVSASQSVETVSAAMKTTGLKLKHPDGMVKSADYEALASQVKELKAREADREFEMLVSAKEHEGKVPPAEMEEFKKYFLWNKEAAIRNLKARPVLVSGSATPVAAGVVGGPAPDRKAMIVSARAQRQAEISAGKVVLGSERTYVHGYLRNAGQPGVSDSEAKELALV